MESPEIEYVDAEIEIVEEATTAVAVVEESKQTQIQQLKLPTLTERILLAAAELEALVGEFKLYSGTRSHLGYAVTNLKTAAGHSLTGEDTAER